MSAIAIASLALGIGANTTIFTLVNAMLLRPLPVADPSRLAAVHTVDPRNPGLLLCSYPNYLDYRTHNRVFSSLLFYVPSTITLIGYGDPRLLMGHLVSAGYFETLGVKPAIGRAFLPEEDGTTGTSPVVVLSHRFWKRQFGGDPDAIKRTLRLGAQSYRVVGVAPEGFSGLNEMFAADAWVPLASGRQLYANRAWIDQRRMLLFSVVGRLQPGVRLAQAEAGMQALATELERQYPKDNEGRVVRLTPATQATLSARTRAVVSDASLVLLIVSSLVLLIACGNVANLLLARGAGRVKEISVRLALGASRWYLVRQLLTESVVLSLAGGVVGLIIAKWASTALWWLRPPIFNRAGIEVTLDAQVLAYTLVVSLATGILFGLVPALRMTRGDLASDLRERMTNTTGSWQLRGALVAGQVAFSVVALVGASLFLRSLLGVSRIDPGFAPDRLGIVAFHLGDAGYSEARGREYQRRALAAAVAVPGVGAVSIARDAPLRVSAARTVLLAGQENTVAGRGRATLTSVVWPGYFQTTGIPILGGRDFSESDTPSSPRGVIVNEIAAAHFWPGENPVGRRIHFQGDPLPAEVIGVARTANYQAVGEQPQALLYLSLTQYYFPAAVLYLRTAGDPELVSAAVRRQMQTLDRNLVLQSESVGRTIRESLWAQQLSASLLAVFGGLALLLSTMGLHGVISYSVSQRVREIGVRMALGATPGDVQTMVLREGIRLLAFGIAAGILIALGASRAVRSMLVGIPPNDLVTFVSVPFVLAVIAAAACWLPARRATRVDPAIALRP